MAVLSDLIENFIKSLLSDGDAQVDLQRNELASYFKCAPSQINYVLATRFTPNHGYIIESRRGGGGYVRIVRIIDDGDALLNQALNRLQTDISYEEAQVLLNRLLNIEIADQKTVNLMLAAVDPRALAVPMAVKDALRAKILYFMLLANAREGMG